MKKQGSDQKSAALKALTYKCVVCMVARFNLPSNFLDFFENCLGYDARPENV